MLAPRKKVLAGGVGGSLATVIVWGAHTFAGIDVTPEAAGSLATLFGFVLAYFKAD